MSYAVTYDTAEKNECLQSAEHKLIATGADNKIYLILSQDQQKQAA